VKFENSIIVMHLKRLFNSILVVGSLCLMSCQNQKIDNKTPEDPYIFVLGVAQDAGYPQINCEKDCCQRAYINPLNKRLISSIALVDPVSRQEWIFDATPDFSSQLKLLNNHTKRIGDLPEGVFLTHAHMGHYTGLMFLGREAMGAINVPVYTMPRMKNYLETNGPWSQLVDLKNISLKEIQKGNAVVLNERISVTPLQVPHRDEFSETVGFLINASSKKVLFIPDIDKWELWEQSINKLIQQVDIALLDATFFKNGEINRDMSEVPHPFVSESMDLFKSLSSENKSKVHFIHFNHTNPLLIENSEAQKSVLTNGFNIASDGKIIVL